MQTKDQYSCKRISKKPRLISRDRNNKQKMTSVVDNIHEIEYKIQVVTNLFTGFKK